MASTYSPSARPDRRIARREQTIGEALDVAVTIMAEVGVGGLSMSEVARRIGIRQPSLYKYFPSLHGLYDALFARGVELSSEAMRSAVAPVPRGVPALRAAGQALVRWAVENPALAQLLFWRPVPGFAPAAETFAASERQVDELHAALRTAVRAGALHPDAASAAAARLYTIVLSGVISQQLANEPAAGYDSGLFSTLTDAALDMFFARYEPAAGGNTDRTAMDLVRRPR
jgi:AcrR family transcriptional regulator